VIPQISLGVDNNLARVKQGSQFATELNVDLTLPDIYNLACAEFGMTDIGSQLIHILRRIVDCASLEGNLNLGRSPRASRRCPPGSSAIRSSIRRAMFVFASAGLTDYSFGNSAVSQRDDLMQSFVFTTSALAGDVVPKPDLLNNPV
jgi:hypothetical protein